MSYSFRYFTSAVVFLFAILFTLPAHAQRKSKEDQPSWAKTSLSAFNFRNVGPATTSGRIADLAVDAQNPGTMYLALASSGVWKTTNNGTTFEPIFDNQGSYSTGCIAIDPNNSNVIGSELVRITTSVQSLTAMDFMSVVMQVKAGLKVV